MLKIFKILGTVLGVVLMIFIVLILLVRSPWGQGILVDKAISFLRSKTGTEISVGRLFITFSGNVYLEEFYLEDQNQDTLLYSKKLETGIAILPLINSGEIHITKLDWDGLVARVKRSEMKGRFNFEFLLDSFSADSSQVAAPDTVNSEPLRISLAPASLRNFDLVYQDEVSGIDAKLKLGELKADISAIDLEEFLVEIRQLSLTNSQAHYLQSKSYPPSEESASTSELPKIKLDHLTISEVGLTYESLPDEQHATLSIGNFEIQIPEADLTDQFIHLSKLQLKNSALTFSDYSQEKSVDFDPAPASDTLAFSWPDWKIRADYIDFDSTSIGYKTSHTPIQKGQFNPENIAISNLKLLAEDLSLADKKAAARLLEFHFSEGSGFELAKFQFDFKLNDQAASITDLQLQTNQSRLSGSTKLGFESIEDLILRPEKSRINMEIYATELDINDAFFFAPELAKDTLLREIARFPIVIEGALKGNPDEINVDKLLVNWSNTKVAAQGQILSPLEMDLLQVDLPEISIQTERSDLIRFIDEKSLGINLPESLQLQSEFRGKLDDLVANLDLETSLGNLALKGSFENKKELRFDADLQVKTLQLGALLNAPELDTLSFEVRANGSGKDLYSLTADLNSNFSRLRISEGDYSGLQLSGHLVEGAGDIRLGLQGEFLDFALLTRVDLDSANSEIDLNLDLRGADFRELGLTGKNTRAKLKLQANFQGNPEAFDLTTKVTEANIFHETRNYPIGDLSLTSYLRADSTSVEITSSFLNGFLRTNSNPTDLQAAMTDLFAHYLDSTAQKSSERDSIQLTMDMRISPDPVLTEVLLPGLTSFDSARVKADFVQQTDSLLLAIDFPYLNYNGTEIDSLHASVNADTKDLALDLGFVSLNTGPIAMQKTSLSGVMANSVLKMKFLNYQDADILMQLPFAIGISGDSIQVRLSSENLKLNGADWKIPANNSITYSTEKLQFIDFDLRNQNQRLQIQNDLPGFTEKNLALEFSNFKLENLTRLLNPSDTLAAGSLQGQLVVENPFGAMGIMGKINVDSLTLMDTPLGQLTLDATAKSLGNYLFALSLQDKGLDLGLNGDFVADEAGGTFDLELDLREISMDKIASLSQGQISEGSGYLSGKISANGSSTDPIYAGEFHFNGASFTPTQLSTKYFLSQESISIDNDGLYLDQFTFRDGENNTFSIDGKVLTESFSNPSFDLQVNAENFLAINSTNEENDLVYGKASLDADIRIRGDLNLPQIQAKLRIRDNTDLTVIIPESELDVVQREGVVNFVNKSDPNDILSRPLEETSSAFSGYEIHASLAVDPQADFKIIIDPYTGDNLTLAGDSELQLDINPNGRITLTGAYEVNGGSYEMSLYNLISKKFDINPGSRITWNGDPMDANLDIRAIYEVETSAADLMSAQLSGSDSEVQNQYQQRLKFLVYLNVKGELLKPEITFTLDMPESDRGSFGGNVYSRVLQINGQEDELNKQVFSLLVLDRFFPSQGSDGSSGGAEAIARNSASRLLSDQMNALSSKLFGDSGFTLGFDVDSYQDYQSGTGKNRTDLNINAQQTLFDDKLIVQVGSQVGLEGSTQTQEQEANSLLANISFEYMLTEDGRWRVRAFRKNQYESIIDGQLFVTGIGLIFNREFNEFSEFWKPSPTEKELKEKAKKVKKDQKKSKKETTDHE